MLYSGIIVFFLVKLGLTVVHARFSERETFFVAVCLGTCFRTSNKLDMTAEVVR